MSFKTATRQIGNFPARWVACAESVTFITDFGFNGRHDYYYVALDRGYCKDAGLEVSIVPGSARIVRRMDDLVSFISLRGLLGRGSWKTFQIKRY